MDNNGSLERVKDSIFGVCSSQTEQAYQIDSILDDTPNGYAKKYTIRNSKSAKQTCGNGNSNSIKSMMITRAK